MSAPLRWDEIDNAEPADLTVLTVPARVEAIGDLHADIDAHPFDIAPLLEWAARDEATGEGQPDAGG